MLVERTYSFLEKQINKKKLTFVFSLVLLNFVSGLPLLLILSTLGVRLLEIGISKTTLGVFAWVSVAYGFKIFLAPLINNIKIPILHQAFGQRRSWLLVIQILLSIALYCLGLVDPHHHLLLTAGIAFFIGCLGAMLDIVLEAYRVEIVDLKGIGAMASTATLGYRVGMLSASAGALYLANFYSWQAAYSVMSYCVLLSLFATFYAVDAQYIHVTRDYRENIINFIQAIKKYWRPILGLIFCFKVADAMLAIMNVPFLLDLGFNKLQIANIVNNFGMLAIIVGSIIGGKIIDYYGLKSLFKLSSLLQIVVCLLFIMHSLYATHVLILYITLGLESFTSGILQVGIIAYLSLICIREKNSLYYAVLSSLAALVRINSNVLAGFIADHCGWVQFYFLVGCITIANVYWLKKKIHGFLLCSEVKSEYKV